MRTIFKTISGSRAYGTNLPTSDTDYKGVYIQSTEDILGFKYKEQMDHGKDETYYEIRRFLQLLSSANLNMLEMLYMPEECIQYQDTLWYLIERHRDKFLTQKCLQSFGGYAVQQIKKAKGLDKKMNYEKDRVERKTPFYFCHVIEGKKTIPLEKWLEMHAFKQEHCGLAAIDHFKDCYNLYYDYSAHYGPQGNRTSEAGFRGICLDESNGIRLSEIPKDMSPTIVMSYNKDAYTMHCKDFNEYQTWLENRNTERFVDTEVHGQKIDGKNLLHCRRLLDMALEIATDHTITVKRPNREELLKIRKGEVDLNDIIKQAEKDIKLLDEIFPKSGLPKEVDFEFVHTLLVKIRRRHHSREILDAHRGAE